ncbi:hypothetical protein TNCV_2311721 [Trichonephila clavipes]|nr:hypothetical protein TNCV_2311721 [Trichonephila clavipes]
MLQIEHPPYSSIPKSQTRFERKELAFEHLPKRRLLAKFPGHDKNLPIQAIRDLFDETVEQDFHIIATDASKNEQTTSIAEFDLYVPIVLIRNEAELVHLVKLKVNPSLDRYFQTDIIPCCTTGIVRRWSEARDIDLTFPYLLYLSSDINLLEYLWDEISRTGHQGADSINIQSKGIREVCVIGCLIRLTNISLSPCQNESAQYRGQKVVQYYTEGMFIIIWPISVYSYMLISLYN